MKLALFLAGALIPGPMLAAPTWRVPEPLVEITFTLRASDAKQCTVGNGCMVFHVDTLDRVVKDLEDKAHAKGKAECKV